MSPDTVTPPTVPRTSSIFEAGSKPRIAPSRSRSVPARGALSTGLPLWVRRKWIAGWASAMACTSRSVWASSAWALFRNLSRAGVLKKRSWASTRVPGVAATSSFSATAPPSPRTSVPVSEPRSHESTEKRVTAQMAGSASPLNPSVAIASRSLSVASLEVACRVSARSTSSGAIPVPSSLTRMSWRPASLRSTAMAAPSASMAFSTSSLTTEAGRSTTSPAAILLTR